MDSNGQNNFKYSEIIKSFFCINKGKAKLDVTLNKKVYSPGEKGEVVVAVNNKECSADVECFTYSVVSIIKDKDGHQRVEA